MIRVQIVTSSLLLLFVSTTNGFGNPLPNRIPLYQCQRTDGPQSSSSMPPRKPHVFVYVEDRAFKNIAQQIRYHPRKYSNYEITKGEVPYPIGCSGGPQQVLHVRSHGGYTNQAYLPPPSLISTQIPSPPLGGDESDASCDTQSDKVGKTNKDSILVQIPINKYFDCKNTEILIKIAKKEDASKLPNKVDKKPVVQTYSDVSGDRQKQSSELNRNDGDILQQMCMAQRNVQPASYLNTEIATQTPRIVELPISFEGLPSSQSPQQGESQPQYMVLPSSVLESSYPNHPSTPTTDDQIKNIVFPESERQQNTPEDCTPVGYSPNQSHMVNLNEHEQADYNAYSQHATNNNVPIQDIDVGEFEAFAQQQQHDENQTNCEKCINKTMDDDVEVKNENASMPETKKNNGRHKTKSGRKDDKQYGLILGPVEP